MQCNEIKLYFTDSKYLYHNDFIHITLTPDCDENLSKE